MHAVFHIVQESWNSHILNEYCITSGVVKLRKSSPYDMRTNNLENESSIAY